MKFGAQTYTVRTFTQNERDFRESMKRQDVWATPAAPENRVF